MNKEVITREEGLEKIKQILTIIHDHECEQYTERERIVRGFYVLENLIYTIVVRLRGIGFCDHELEKVRSMLIDTINKAVQIKLDTPGVEKVDR